MNFQKVKLSDVANIYSGFAFKANDLVDDGIPVIKIANIQNRNVLKECLTFLPTELFNEKLNKYKLVKDDILIAMTGAGSVGKIGKMRSVDKTYLVNQRVGIIRINNKKAIPEYIYQKLACEYYEDYYYGLGLGAGQPNLSPSDIGNLEIEVPSIDTQTKIASILSAYDDLIENNTRRIQILEQMAQTIYKEWFVNFRFPATAGMPGYENTKFVDSPLGKIPEGWEAVKVKDLYNTSSGGTPSRTKPEYYINGNINWLKTRELNDSFIFETEEKINNAGLKNSSAKLFPAFTVMIALYGATIGKLGVLTKESSTNQACCALISRDTTFNYCYIFLYLLHNRKRIVELRQGAAQQNISQELIRELEIVKPSLVIMNNFNDSIMPIFNLIANLQSKKNNLRRTRDLLLPKLMSGEVEVV